MGYSNQLRQVSARRRQHRDPFFADPGDRAEFTIKALGMLEILSTGFVFFLVTRKGKLAET